jgi:PKD-like domain
MKSLFILVCILFCNITQNLSAQCNRPTPSDNPCNASTFCNTAQLEAFCSAIPTPIVNKVYMKPNGFCGSLESPSWFKFVAESASLTLRFTATACGVNGVQAVMLSATNCSDSATYTAVSNCSNPTGGQPIADIMSNTLVAGQTYYLLVDGYQGAGCNYTIDVVAGTIRTTTTPLPTPSVIFGPTTVCANATNVTFSVPKVANATDYRFVVTNTTTNTVIFNDIRTDSFYTVASFPATGTVQVCVSYRNDCTESTAFCSNISVGGKVIVNAPTVYLCFGDDYLLPDGTTIVNNNLSSTDDTLTTCGNNGYGRRLRYDHEFHDCELRPPRRQPQFVLETSRNGCCLQHQYYGRCGV